MLDRKNITDTFNSFAKYVIKQSRTNLTKKKKNVTGKGYESLDYTLTVSPNSFALSFIMEDYLVYQDKGVSGTKTKYKKPFKYTNKQPPVNDILKWVNARRLRLRDKETGRFKKGGQKSLSFLIARSIKEKGIKPSLFFTKPFERAFNNLPEDVVESFGLDVDKFLKSTTK